MTPGIEVVDSFYRLRGGLWHWNHDNTTHNGIYWRDHVLPRMVVGLGSSFLIMGFNSISSDSFAKLR